MKIRRSILKEKLFLFLSANCRALWAAPNTPACSSVSLTGSMIIFCEKNDTETVNSDVRAEQQNLNTSI